MTSFKQELLGSHGFSLIPLYGLHAIIFANFQLLLPTKSVVAYARRHMLGGIVDLLYLSGRQRRRGGTCMLVSSP